MHIVVSFENKMPKNLIIGNFRHPVPKLWLKPCCRLLNSLGFCPLSFSVIFTLKNNKKFEDLMNKKYSSR